MLKAEIIEKLKEITPEEREILDGQSEIDRNIYMQGSGNTVNSQKLLELGKLITVRKHTRFIDFPEHTHDYVELVYMLSGQTVHIVDGKKITLKQGELLFLGQNSRHAIEKAEELAKETGGTIMGQFVNPSNPEAHYKTTGVEIYEDMDGAVDYFVAGVGTGGTITGVGKYLKEKKADVKVVAVEPYSSPVISEGRAGKHGIQGIGAGFIPETLDVSVIDEVIAVKDEDAFNLGKTVSGAEGFLVGISSGAALWAATEVAKREESKGKNIIVILPDSGDRYLSTTMFD